MSDVSESQRLIRKPQFWRTALAWSVGIALYYTILLLIYCLHESNYLGRYLRDDPKVSQNSVESPITVIKGLEQYFLMAALEAYRKEHGAYPLLPDNPIGDLKKLLVSGGYPLAGFDADKDARYLSLDGKSYGFRFHRPHACVVEVHANNTTWWGAPKCPF
jgi:hypothetical protein